MAEDDFEDDDDDLQSPDDIHQQLSGSERIEAKSSTRNKGGGTAVLIRLLMYC